MSGLELEPFPCLAEEVSEIRVVVCAVVSLTKTSSTLFESPETKFEEIDWNAMNRPSPETDAC
jgi:hypothetical protein